MGQAAGESYLLDAATLDVIAGPVPQSAWGADVDPLRSTIALAQQTGLTLAQRSGEADSNGLEATTTLAREVSDVAFTDDDWLDADDEAESAEEHAQPIGDSQTESLFVIGETIGLDEARCEL